MESTPLLLKEFNPFTLESTVAEVKAFFNETTFSHFPIVEENHLHGMISETEIQGIDNDESRLGDFQFLFNFFLVEEHIRFLDLLKIYASNETNIVPVLDDKKRYMGYYDLIEVMHIYNATPFLHDDGAIISLQKEKSSYSFSAICQIVESNNGQVLGLFLEEEDADEVKITVKFHAPEVNEILQSFRRYNYKVLSNLKEDLHLEDLKERSSYLQKYLNI